MIPAKSYPYILFYRMPLIQNVCAHSQMMTHDAVCAVVDRATVQSTAWMSRHALNDWAFQCVCIFTLGDRWECAKGKKCETQLDSRYTLDGVHTLPLTLGLRSSHTTHRPVAPRLSDTTASH